MFTRGFIRAYSRHLGLDPDEMVNAYLADVDPGRGRTGGAKGGRMRSRFLRGRRAAAGTIVVSVTAILLVLGLIARPQRRSGAGTPVAARPAAPVSFKNVAVSPVMDPVAPQQTAAAPTSVASGVSMILEFEQDSWTEVIADGQPIFSGLIRHGTRRTFEAHDGFRLTLGNAGGVRVTIDGRALEPLGGAGQVIRDYSLPVRLTQS